MRRMIFLIVVIMIAASITIGCGTNGKSGFNFDLSAAQQFGISKSDLADTINMEDNQSTSADNGRYDFPQKVSYEGIDFTKYLLFDITDNTLCGTGYEYVLKNDDNSEITMLELLNDIKSDISEDYGEDYTHLGGSTQTRMLEDIPDNDLTGIYQEYYWYPKDLDNCEVKLTLDAVTAPEPMINVSCRAYPDKESLRYDFDFGFAKYFGVNKTEACEKLGIDISKLTLSNTGVANIDTVEYSGTEFARHLMFDKVNNDTLYGVQYRHIIKSEDYSGSSISQLVNEIRTDMVRIYGNPSTYPETNTAFEKFVPADDNDLSGQYEEYWHVSGEVPCSISLKLDAMGNDMFTVISVSYKTGPDLYGVRKSATEQRNN
ncbi:MAG: hypothetical protein IJ365_02165 [Clostridia bacterium]|nr:hypothetical protein [Clostridia bacterium]